MHGFDIADARSRSGRRIGLQQVLARRRAQQQHDPAVMAVRTPQIVVVVGADRRRQAPGAAKHIDGRRLAVVTGEEHGPRLIRRRQGLVGLADGGGHLAPAEHVGVVGRQFADRLVVDGRVLALQPGGLADGALIGDEPIDRQDRQGERGQRRSGEDCRGDDRPTRRAAVDGRLYHHRSAGQQDRIDGGRVIGLAVDQQHHGHQDHPRDGQPTRRGEPGPEGETRQARDPDRRGERADDQHLLQQIG